MKCIKQKYYYEAEAEACNFTKKDKYFVHFFYIFKSWKQLFFNSTSQWLLPWSESVRKKNSVEKDFSCGICVCKKGKNTNKTWQEKDLGKTVHDYGKANLFSKVYTRLRRSEGPIENVSQVFFYFVFELLHIVFWKLVLLISATTLTSGIFTHTPTNVSLTLIVAVWVWALPLNKELQQHTYCSISHELKATIQWNLVS